MYARSLTSDGDDGSASSADDCLHPVHLRRPPPYRRGWLHCRLLLASCCHRCWQGCSRPRSKGEELQAHQLNLHPLAHQLNLHPLAVVCAVVCAALHTPLAPTRGPDNQINR